MTGPEFSSPPKFNHVAVSVSPAELDAVSRAAIVEFYGDLLGTNEYAELTEDRSRLVLGLHTHEQFFFIVGEDDPMRAPRMDHVGVSVSSLQDFDEVARRAASWQQRLPDEVELIGPSVEEFAGVLRLHSFYVGYRLPILVEVQHFEFIG